MVLKDSWDIANAVVSLATALLHSVCLYLLFTIKRSRNCGTQVCYLRHLSLAELLYCITQTVVIVSILQDKSGNIQEHSAIVALVICFQIILSGVWYLMIMTLTIDRLLVVKWNFEYPIYWTASRANKLCIGHWVFSATFGITAAVLYFAAGINMLDPKITWLVFMSLDSLFLFVAVIAYTYMFVKYKQSLKSLESSRHNRHSTAKSQSILAIFRGSKFWFATLILGMYTILVAIPDVTANILAFQIKDPKRTELMFRVAQALFMASIASDAVIYILLTPSVKAALFKALKSARKGQETTPPLQSMATSSRTTSSRTLSSMEAETTRSREISSV